MLKKLKNLKNSSKKKDPLLKNAAGLHDVHLDQQLGRSELKKAVSTSYVNKITHVASVFVFIFIYACFSFVGFTINQISMYSHPVSPYAKAVYQKAETREGFLGYRELKEDGSFATEEPLYYKEAKDIPIPEWYKDAQYKKTIGYAFLHNCWKKLIVSLLLTAFFWGICNRALLRHFAVLNADADIDSLNQWQNDGRIELLDDMLDRYTLFPDIGAHSTVAPNALISHLFLDNSRSLKKFEMAYRHDKNVYEDGELVAKKGDIIYDDDGNAKTYKTDVFDLKFGDNLQDASFIEQSEKFLYDPTKIIHNAKRSREKLPYDTLADLINNDWVLPLYEPQRPTGAYLVDNGPSNSMLLAITRAGKGQRYIEPLIDMQLRSLARGNIVINDPKGEFLRKFYNRATIRGFEVIQFNLMVPLNTDIYNPLALAADAARQGNAIECASYVSNIADVFFPKDGGEDPLWPTAANNALCDLLSVA